MYLPIANPLQKGDIYYVLSSNANPLLRKEEEEYEIISFKAVAVTPLICYGQQNGEETTILHSLNKICRTKVQALMKLKRCYAEKKQLFEDKIKIIEDKLTKIQKELPYV